MGRGDRERDTFSLGETYDIGQPVPLCGPYSDPDTSKFFF